MFQNINVTKTYFPPIEEYTSQIDRIWKNEWLTNNGELYQELVSKLSLLLNLDFIIPMTNGTLPIQIALNAFGKNGEIITTPFSYVATTSSIIWEKCTPVFVDIDPEYLTIDETKIESVITNKTTCILATHVFGNPCNIDIIEKIAKKYSLTVIYDAAHCFGVNYKDKSVFSYGDISTCSFHATKVFHTGEGGMAVCRNIEIYDQLHYRHNFGHNGTLDFHGVGINAKMSELQAAMGLAVLPHMEEIFYNRKRVCDFYDKNIDYSKYSKIKIRPGTDWNYSYYPVIFETEHKLLQVEKQMNKEGIYPRRYFFPTLEELPYINSSNCRIAKEIADKILCLPLYHSLEKNELKRICKLL